MKNTKFKKQARKTVAELGGDKANLIKQNAELRADRQELLTSFQGFLSRVETGAASGIETMQSFYNESVFVLNARKLIAKHKKKLDF